LTKKFLGQMRKSPSETMIESVDAKLIPMPSSGDPDFSLIDVQEYDFLLALRVLAVALRPLEYLEASCLKETAELSFEISSACLF